MKLGNLESWEFSNSYNIQLTFIVFNVLRHPTLINTREDDDREHPYRTGGGSTPLETTVPYFGANIIATGNIATRGTGVID